MEGIVAVRNGLSIGMTKKALLIGSGVVVVLGVAVGVPVGAAVGV